MNSLTHAAAALGDSGAWPMAITPRPSPALHPLGVLFLVVVSWIWPIYFLARAAVGASIGGLLKDAPFKLAAVGLLWILVNRLRHAAGGVGTSNPGFCERYVHAEFEYLSVFMFGFVIVAEVIRRAALRERAAQLIHRPSWPVWMRGVDGAAALGLTVVSAPWFLAAVQQLIGLPPSHVVDFALRASDSILGLPRIGYTYGHLLGGGKSFVETFTENLNTKFTGHTSTVQCGGSAYQGRWLAAMVPAVLLIPVAIGLSCDWFSSDAKWLSIWTLGLRDRADSDSTAPAFEAGSGAFTGEVRTPLRARSAGLVRAGVLVFGGWMLLSAVVFVVRIATGV